MTDLAHLFAPLRVAPRPLDADRSTQASAVSSAERVGHYVLDGRLGEGGMGEVWAAVDERDGRRVAVKFADPEIASDPRGRRRFLAEADVLARLDHPGIVRVIDTGGAEGEDPYLVMEAIDGVSLRRLLAAARLDPESFDRGLAALAASVEGDGRSRSTRRWSTLDRCVVEWCRQVAEALAHAHDHGVLHRDVSPGNVLVDVTGRARLIDFGVARAVAEAGLTIPGDILGTPGYIAPEAWTGEPVQRSDVFSLGAVLFEALTGTRAYGEHGPHPGLRGPEAAMPPSLAEHRPALRGPLDWTCRKALAWSLADRYATARAFSSDLSAVERGQRTLARPPQWRLRVLEQLQRHPVRARLEIAFASALLLALMASIGWLALSELASARARADAARSQEADAHAAIRSTLAAIRAGASESWRLDDRHILSLLRLRDYGASGYASDALDEITGAVLRAKHETWRGAGDVAGLDDAIDELDRAGARDACGTTARAALSEASRRLEARDGRPVEEILSRSVDSVVRGRGASTLCAALARLGDARRAVPSLVRYMRAQVSEWNAAEVGAALAVLASMEGADEAAVAVREAARRFPTGGTFWSRALLQLPVGAAGPAYASDDAVAPHPAFGGRRVNGEVADSSGAWLLDLQYIDSWLMAGPPHDGVQSSREDVHAAQLALELDPRSSAAWANLGDAWARAGESAEATRAYLGALELDPSNETALAGRANARRVSGDVFGAVCDFERLCRVHSTGLSWARLAMARNDAGDRKRAIEDATESIRLDQGASAGYLYRGMARLADGDAEGALRDQLASIERGFGSPETFHCKACSLRALGRTDASIVDEREAVGTLDGYILGWNGLGVALLRKSDELAAHGGNAAARSSLEESERAFTRAVILDAHLPFAWSNRGVARLHMGRLDDAESDFTEAIVRLPRLPHPYLGRAIARSSLNKTVAAAADATSFLTLSPNDSQAEVARKIAARSSAVTDSSSRFNR